MNLALVQGLTLHAGALEDYLAKPDSAFAWKEVSRTNSGGFTIAHIEFTSQNWREQPWQHHLQIVRPAKIRNPDTAFLFITGDGSGRSRVEMLKVIAEQAGVVAAVVTKVPNQPLYNGRKEDALIAYTFDQYLKTGDPTWPLLFPMVKSAVRAMDAVQEVSRKAHDQKIERFVVSGASKRGWTTWLTGATDPRVAAIAPMVIDMLNMRAQSQWAEKAYGKQSEQISDYTDLNLIARMDEPRMVELRGWVDPYAYRARYTMPKLILLGTNDPYWVVDSLRHYWSDLPEPKLVFQTPNAGHDLDGGREAIQTLAAFVEIIADRKTLPKMQWTLPGGDKTALGMTLDQPAQGARLWIADSTDRDFRNDKWTSHPVEIGTGSRQASVNIEAPTAGYRAYLGEISLKSPGGHPYKLSTEARVLPDMAK